MYIHQINFSVRSYAPYTILSPELILNNQYEEYIVFTRTRTRKIIPYCTILITGLSLLRKINFLLRVCKTGRRVYILHARHISLIVVYIFFRMQDFLIFYSLNTFKGTLTDISKTVSRKVLFV